jgi:hypothetical protein
MVQLVISGDGVDANDIMRRMKEPRGLEQNVRVQNMCTVFKVIGHKIVIICMI